MPSGGLIPFLQEWNYRRDTLDDDSVNALERAYTISTEPQRHRWRQGNVSMPSGGLLPFLLTKYSRVSNKKNDVSMPSGGLLPFLPSCLPIPTWMVRGRVNALWRAFTISPLPPQKPFIYAGFQPRFCG